MKDLDFVKPGIYIFTLWYGNLNSRTLICKENYIHYLFGAHGVFCYARSFASFRCPYFVLYLSLGLVKVNPHLMASDNICERLIVVFRELFQQLFCDSYPSKFCLACEAEARHMYCFSGGVVVGGGGGGVNFLCLGHFLGNYKG